MTVSTRVLLALMAFGAMLAAGFMTMAGAHAAPVGDTSSAFSGPAGDHNAQAMWTDIIDFANGTVPEAGALGQSICAAMGEGYSEGQEIASISKGDSSKVIAVRYIVHASEWHYCPEFY